MTFEEVIKELQDNMDAYDKVCSTVPKAEAQNYRDKISHLSVTLAVYCADFYKDWKIASFRRKIEEEKEKVKLVASGVGIGKAESSAKVACESWYESEVLCESLYKKAEFFLDETKQFRNSIASRMQTFE